MRPDGRLGVGTLVDREQLDLGVMVQRLEDLYERPYAGRRGRRVAG
jgi:hypothetical protein